jgi:phosphate transport system substrate-binding protein
MRGVPATRDTLRIVAAAPVASVVKQMTYWLDDPIRQAGSQTERVESGEDFRTFCKGVGLEHPDIDAAARRISNAEFQSCVQNGVDQIVELKLGYQAIVVARTMAGGPEELSARDIFLGLARQVPDPADRTRLIDNPHRTWDQINPRLENQYIEVYGPGRGTPLYSDFMSILMEAGCNAFPWIEALQETDSILHNTICHTLRQDGVYMESLPNAELIQQKLGASPNAVAITTYAFYTRNRNALIGNVLGHVDPTLENISAGTFPGSRTLYLYVKKEHLRLVPSLRRFVYDGVSDGFIGSGGPLAREVGLIPLDDADRKLTREIASDLRELKLP